MEKIRQGLFIDFKDMLTDNISLLQQIQDLGQRPQAAQPRLREVKDVLTWVHCFLSFLAVKSDNEQVRDLAAYGQIIIQIAKQHGGRGWASYDKLFRQQLAAGATHSWREIDTSLLASTVLCSGSQGGQSCSHCFSWDHVVSECALASHELPPAKRFRSRPPGELETCHRFNRGLCKMSPSLCKFEHACSYCGKSGHGAIDCPKKKEKGERPT